MKKRIALSLSPVGINRAIKEVENYKQYIQERTELLVTRLGEIGVQVATVNFAQAQYDGVNDVSVKFESRGKSRVAVVALGNATLFIEFGTGVYYSSTHPEASQHGMTRGGYGQGKGKQRTWGYYGEPGTNGVPTKVTEKGTLILTHGNPANMSMYNTVRELEQRFDAIAKEVFGI